MKRADIEEMYRRFSDAEAEPRGELVAVNPYTLLVAVVLSAQATDVGVNKATRKLFKKVDTPEKMLALGEAGLRDHIKTIGLYNTKAKNVIGLSHILVESHGGQVPGERTALEALPGVGRKTAKWSSTPHSASPPSLSTPIYSASATAPDWRRERLPWKSRKSW